MATKKVYDECCRILRRHPEYHLDSKNSKRVYKPDMKFLFGKKELISEVEFLRCSESEKRRHLMEDHVLWSTYIKLYSHADKSVDRSAKRTLALDIDGIGKQFTFPY